jgi:hypothetical protein
MPCTLPEVDVAIDRTVLTPQQRLAISRRALFRELDYGPEEATSIPLSEDGHNAPESAPFVRQRTSDGFLSGFPVVAIARNVGERWWRRHPANAMVQVATPMLARYARKQPAKLMAYAAGTGALLVILRPWRLLSVTALVAAVFKTSDVADMVTTLMHSNTQKSEIE